jgi:uncharacterized protein (TIGR02117 family)
VRFRRPLWLIGAILALTLMAMALSSVRAGDRALYPARAGEPAVVIYLVDNGFHTDIALPSASLDGRGGALAEAAGRIRAGEWVLVGWGDAAFYQGRGLSAARVLDGLRALFTPGNRAVLQVATHDGRPDRVFAATAPIRLSEAGYARLLARLDASFAPGPRLVGPGGGRSAFFESAEHFGILKLCNHWTGEVLSAAGLPTTGVLHITPAGLKLDLKLRAGLNDG